MSTPWPTGARAAGWGVALDDVGAGPGSLALMPFLRSDVVKLDLHLVQQRPAEHEQMAGSLGATPGQGWRFGRRRYRRRTPPPCRHRSDRPALPGADERPVNRSRTPGRTMPHATVLTQAPGCSETCSRDGLWV